MGKHVEVTAYVAGHDGRVYRQAGSRWSVPEEELKDGKPANGQDWWGLPEDAPELVKPKSKTPPGAGPKKGSASGEEETPGAGPQ